VNRYDAIKFDRVTDELTSLSLKLAYYECICEIHLPMLASFNRINSRLVGSASGESKDRLSGVEARLLMETNFLQPSLQGILVQTRYLSKSALKCKSKLYGLLSNYIVSPLTHIPREIYSLIAQKENALSMRDNAALMTISEDPKRIALAAKQDNASCESHLP
jgi:hypothetical protein